MRVQIIFYLSLKEIFFNFSFVREDFIFLRKYDINSRPWRIQFNVRRSPRLFPTENVGTSGISFQRSQTRKERYFFIFPAKLILHPMDQTGGKPTFYQELFFSRKKIVYFFGEANIVKIDERLKHRKFFDFSLKKLRKNVSTTFGSPVIETLNLYNSMQPKPKYSNF